MSHLTLEARPRTITGKKVKILRRQGLLPANIYGHNVESQAVEIDAHEFTLMQRHLSASSIIDLKVAGTARAVMIHRTQRDFATGKPNHIEFFQINMLEKLTASVPLVLVGHSDALRKNAGVVLIQEMNTIDVTCLPGDLPTSIEVSVEHLTNVGDAIHVSDLNVDRSKLEIRANADDRVAGLSSSQMHAAEEEAGAAESAEAGAEGETAPEGEE
ncbi:MAG: large subunit ribosomal protein [Chloroflexi bacterium]|nr:large subunit ribosomal protein [Chloroflexota bacterium]